LSFSYWCDRPGCTKGYFWRKHLQKHIDTQHNPNNTITTTAVTIIEEDVPEEAGEETEEEENAPQKN